MIELKLPWPPSVNHYYFLVRNRKVIGKKGREYRAAVGLLADPSIPPLEGPLKVEIEVYPPDRRRRDLDNLNKCVLDSLEKANIFLDDSQIEHLTLKKMSIIKGGELKVTITKLGD